MDGGGGAVRVFFLRRGISFIHVVERQRKEHLLDFRVTLLLVLGFHWLLFLVYIDRSLGVWGRYVDQIFLPPPPLNI